MVKSLLTLIFLIIWGFIAQAQAFSEQTYDRPIREVALILSDEGFYPKSLFAYKGERVKFFITSLSERPKCFILTEKEIFLGVKKGEMIEAVVDFDREGNMRFHCPTDKMEGVISVFEHPREKALRIRREIASQNKERLNAPKVWLPKDDLGLLESEIGER